MSERRHTFVPVQRVVMRLRMRCRDAGCGKTKLVSAAACPTCAEAATEHQAAVNRRAATYMQARRDGLGSDAADALAGPMPVRAAACGADDCYRGLIIPKWEPPCCCYRAGTKCIDCERQQDRTEAHQCLVDTPEEIRHELYIRMGAPAGRSNPSKEVRAAAAAMEQAVRLRGPVLHDD